MTRVKICGMTEAEDIRFCAAAGAHALGFVVEYPLEVPWNLNRSRARELMNQVPPLVSRVIVVGDEPERVVALAEFLRPQAVQLHGNEPIDVTKDMIAAIKPLGMLVIKALRFSVETGRFNSPASDPLEAARMIEDAGADALLLDSVSELRPAGTGRSVNWLMARAIRDSLGIPVILAGGLSAGNVGQAIAAVRPWAVDVISGIEDAQGKKDQRKITEFITAAEEEDRGPNPDSENV